jgi:hypothetical protein
MQDFGELYYTAVRAPSLSFFFSLFDIFKIRTEALEAARQKAAWWLVATAQMFRLPIGRYSVGTGLAATGRQLGAGVRARGR